MRLFFPPARVLWDRRLPVLVTLVAAAVLAGGALAFYVASGTGVASASVGSISAPSNLTTQQTGANITVSWTAATLDSGAAVQGYIVKRSDGTTICGSPTLDSSLTCTDTSVPGGTFTYTVTAVFHGFSAATTTGSLTALGAPTITASPSNPSASRAPSISFSNGSGYSCQLDGSGFAPCSSPKSYTALADGSHTFTVHSTQGGSTGPDGTYVWTIDSTPPSITAKPTSTSTSATPSFSFTHTESSYTFMCQLDGSAFTACSSPQAYSGLADGSHTFTVEGVDGAGVATTVASYPWTIDTTAPVTTLALSPTSPNGAGGWYTTAPTFTLSATDTAGSGVASTRYQIDSGTTNTYTTAVTVPEGQHTISYWSTDNAGNAETKNTTATIHVDTTAPTAVLATVPTPASALLIGSTLYYRGNASGSFSLADAVTDSGSGPSSASFPAIATGGWTHGAETVSTGTGSAPTISYSSSTFSWTANPTNPSGYAITSADAAGNLASTPLGFVSDTTAPTGGALNVNGAAATGPGSTSTTTSTTFSITRTDYGETASATQAGLSSSTLSVQSATLTASTCGAAGSGGPFTTPTTITATTQPSGIVSGYCYLYTLAGTDKVGNTATITTTTAVSSPAGFTAASGSPFATGGAAADALAFSPSGGLLATGDQGPSSRVSVFSVGTGGVLTPVSGSPFASGRNPASVAFSPDGTLLAVANVSDTNVSVFSVGGGGTLTPISGSPFATGSAPNSVAFSPDGTLLAVANDGANSISVFSVGSGGALTRVSGSPFATGSSPISLAFGAGGTLLATANQGAGTVSVFSVGSGGALTQVTGSPYATGANPFSVAFSSDGTRLAIANYSSNQVSMFSVAGGGALTPVSGGPFPTGSGPYGVAFSPSGGLVATADDNISRVSVLSVDSGGALSELSASPFTTGGGPLAVAFSPSGGLLATANDDGTVTVLINNTGQ
ncbi:MAG TPA: beta-propeller fold lactonase family protein [Solirubrobacteraceae bacterium]|jgi:6-phosphogluconolactonase (cycloisomerase 2 family)|nr:beta-propeller fold lactonase family protein [Solirubrobacteraceae bacterium]